MVVPKPDGKGSYGSESLYSFSINHSMRQPYSFAHRQLVNRVDVVAHFIFIRRWISKCGISFVFSKYRPWPISRQYLGTRRCIFLKYSFCAALIEIWRSTFLPPLHFTPPLGTISERRSGSVASSEPHGREGLVWRRYRPRPRCPHARQPCHRALERRCVAANQHYLLM